MNKNDDDYGEYKYQQLKEDPDSFVNQGKEMSGVTNRYEQIKELSKRLSEANDKIKELEGFMVKVADKFKCLPDYTMPSTGNQHIFDKIDAEKETINRLCDELLDAANFVIVTATYKEDIEKAKESLALVKEIKND